MKNHASGGALYGLGTIGALVYFVTTATGAMEAILGVFKTIFWPAFIVYKALELLKI